MTSRVEKIFNVMTIPPPEVEQKEEPLKIRCNFCGKVFEQNGRIQGIAGFIYAQCKECRERPEMYKELRIEQSKEAR